MRSINKTEHFSSHSMSTRTRQILLGIFSGLLGCFIYLMPQGWQLEERYGLYWLFQLRGAIPPSDKVMVIAIDRLSASQLGLPVSPNFWPWPRDIHARLIEQLSRAGAEAIVLDLIFHTTGAIPEHDDQLAKAIKNAGNVIIVERLHTDLFDLTDNQADALPFRLIKEQSIPLLPEISDAVFAHAPFPLPDKARVNAYWAFKPGMGDAPTIPVIVFQTYALQIYEDLMALLHAIQAPDIDQLPRHHHQIDNIETVIFFLRQLFTDHPDIRQRIIPVLHASRLDDQRKQLIQSLIKMYADANAHYLNFYGPPRSIHTVPYYRILQSAEAASDAEAAADTLRNTVAGKVVFVGLSATTQSENELIRDAYHTVFTDPEGVKISGVEIAATAFANLLENKPIRPFPYSGSLGLLLIMGLTLGMILPALSSRHLITVCSALAGVYALSAWLIFKQAGIWLPLITPLFIVIPCAIAGAVFLKYLTARQERDQLLTLFGQFTPDRVVGDMIRHMDSTLHKDQIVFGACLFTDVAGYTTLAEKMDMRKLKMLMDDYFNVLSRAVRQNNGVVSEKIGDAMLAIWEAAAASEALREQACEAGLAIRDDTGRFNSDNRHPALPTRIGIHFGQLLISKFGTGSGEDYIYRTVGDLVNTTSRIEAINKRLGTRLLVTHEVMDGLNRFLARPLGSFQFAGKSLPVRLLELIAHKQTASPERVLLCEMFAAALNAYAQQRVDTIQKWQDILTLFPDDGPTRFYLDICRKSPPEQWNPVIQLTEKS